MSTNNPFAPSSSYSSFPHSQEQQAANRYPDISSTLSPSPQPPMQQQQYTNTGYGQQQPMQQMQQYGQSQPQQQQQMYPQPTGYASTSSGFQPSSQFGQYLQASGTGLNFGAPFQQSSTPSYGGGSPQPFQSQQHSQMVADLDPFSRNHQQQSQSQQQQQPQYNTTPSQQAQREVQMYGEHPRDFFTANKQSLEQWAPQAWSRARALLNQLERSWEERKKLVSGWQTWNLGQQDRETVDMLRKEADDNIDTVAAYTLQVKEVFESYRHSSDTFSRNQVRTAMNQGLRILPDWPKTLEAPPKLPDNVSHSMSSSNSNSALFDSLSPQQQQNYQFQNNGGFGQGQNQSYGNQPQQQQGYGRQQQIQQTGYGQQQPGYSQQQQQAPQMFPQQTGFAPGGYQQPMYRQW